jgi:tetratricopeptide (TPR) repeat protein
MQEANSLRRFVPNFEFPVSSFEFPLSDATLAGFLILAASLPYLNTLGNGFVYDDVTQVTGNPYIINFRHLHSIFTTGVWSYVGRQGITNYYRPLMTLGYALCYRLFGNLAFGYHLVNLTLHVGVVCILFGLTLAIFRRHDLAFLAALLFALHPIHTESVAWVAAVTDLELTLFFLLAFWFFLKLPRPGGRRSEWALLGMVVCFVLALLSKEQALMLPLLATIYEHAYREDRTSTSWQEKMQRYGVFWLLALGYLVLRIRIFGSIIPVAVASKVTWPQAFLYGLTFAGQYIIKIVWPVDLRAFYDFNKPSSLSASYVITGILLLAIAAIAFVWLWKRHRALSFGFIWFFGTLAPVLNARWVTANLFAERYLYLPSVGFCWVAAWCGLRIWKAAANRAPRAQPVLAGCFAVLLLLSSVRIFTRNEDWSDNIRLFTRTLAQEPHAWTILIDLGAEYWDRGDLAAAKREWLQAVRVRRNAISLTDLGLVYAEEKKYPEAVAYFKDAMQFQPLYTDPHLDLGVTYRKMGLESLAELQLKAATALSPLDVRAHNELGQLYLSEGNYLKAEQQFRASIESAPNPLALDSLGGICMRHGEPGTAESLFRRALALNPYDSKAYFGLGDIYSKDGKNSMAVREYKAGLQTDPRNEQALSALGKLQQNEPPVQLKP